MMQFFSKTNLFMIGFLVFMMCLTRGSHVLTEFSLPDASLIIFLFLGMFIPSILLFVLFFILTVVIDFGSGFFNNGLALCLTDGYWGLIPTYLVMFYTGKIIKNNIMKFNLFFLLVLAASTLAFMISTNTYYMFSDRFGNPDLLTSMQYGWNYYPEYLLPNLIYATILFVFYTQDLKSYLYKLR